MSCFAFFQGVGKTRDGRTSVTVKMGKTRDGTVRDGMAIIRDGWRLNLLKNVSSS